MQTPIYRMGQASEAEIFWHISACGETFDPPLHETTDLASYAVKIAKYAVTFEAWVETHLVGLVAAYVNDSDKRLAYITHVSVLKEFNRLGIATALLQMCEEHIRSKGFQEINLEVSESNKAAMRLYSRTGFCKKGSKGAKLVMTMLLR